MIQINETINHLDRDIIAFIEKGVDHHDPDTFNDLALRIFEQQFARIPLYRKYCKKRGVTPKTVTSWEELPALPTEAFKVGTFCLLPSEKNRTFMTSGTCNINERGKVLYDEGGLRLMDATIHTAASVMLFPDQVKTKFLVLAPKPEMAPHMVMVYGMNRLIEYFGLPDSCFLVDEQGFDVTALVKELEKAQRENIPVTVCGGSFGFVNFFDFCKRQQTTFQMPEGSRILDAGGFKGRSREIGRQEFLADCEKILGISEDYCVNLLGMTEISSQYYDNTLKNHIQKTGLASAKKILPWTRVQAVEPETLAPLPEGEIGLLRHFDLAGRGHVCAIQTDDLGRMMPEGFEVFGRVRDDGTRGCSLSIDEMTKILEETP